MSVICRIFISPILFINRISSEYKSIFKAGVILLGIALIGISEPMMKVMEIEAATKKLQYEIVEIAKVKAPEFSSIDCYMLIAPNISKCLYANYLAKRDAASITLANLIISSCLIIGAFFIFISVMMFMYNQSKNHNKSNQPDAQKERASV
jgi:hypothetical protein